MEKICRRCGQIFDGHPNSEYCDICRPIATKARLKASNCRYYLKHRERINRKNRERQHEKIIEHRNASPKICTRCGAEFTGHGNRKYCDSCQKIFSSNGRTKRCRERRKTQLAVKKVTVDRNAVQILRERYLAWRLKNRET